MLVRNIANERQVLLAKYRRRKVRYYWIDQVHSAIVFATGKYTTNNVNMEATLYCYCVDNGLECHVRESEIVGSEYCTDEELLTCPHAGVRGLV